MQNTFLEPQAKTMPLLRMKSKSGETDERSTMLNSNRFKAPSDFRRLSMKLNSGGSGDASSSSMQNMTEQNNTLVSESPIKEDLIMDILALEKSLNWTIEHVDDHIDLPLTSFPEILQSNIPDEELIKDQTLIENLQDIVMAWERHILKVLEVYLAKVSNVILSLIVYICFFLRQLKVKGLCQNMNIGEKEKLP